MSRSLFVQADEWFNHSRSALVGEIPCRRGCCQCCIGPFVITLLDTLELRRGLATLDTGTRQDIERQAERQARAMEALEPTLSNSRFIDHWDDRMVDSLVEQFHDVPCPALGSDGACRVYEFRPVTCRLMGIPAQGSSAVSHGACAVQLAVPIARVPAALREEEDRLVGEESAALDTVQRMQVANGTEVLLPYGFLPAAADKTSPKTELDLDSERLA